MSGRTGLVLLLCFVGFGVSAPATRSDDARRCAADFAKYGVDIVAVAARLRGLGEFLGKAGRAKQIPVPEVRAEIAAARKELEALAPSLHVLLGEYRQGREEVSLASAIRAHNLRNQVHFLDLGLHQLEKQLPPGGVLHGVPAPLSERLERLGRAAELLARTCTRKDDEAILLPVPVTQLSEHLDVLMRTTMPERVTASLFGVDPLVGYEVDGDEALLVETFCNLLRNAVAAMNGSGGSLTVRLSTARTVPPADKDAHRALGPAGAGAHVAFAVTDTGSGIEAERLSTIFDGTSTKGDGGNGLGLRHVASVVRKHRGVVDVASAVGKGTTFTVYLPLLPPRVAAPSPTEAGAPGEADVLVVDDNHDGADSAAIVLGASLEKTAVAFYKGKDALARLVRGRRQVVFLDLNIPGDDEHETIAAIRRENPEARIVIQSGYAETAAPAVAEKVDGWVLKPMDIEKAVKQIASLFR